MEYFPGIVINSIQFVFKIFYIFLLMDKNPDAAKRKNLVVERGFGCNTLIH